MVYNSRDVSVGVGMHKLPGNPRISAWGIVAIKTNRNLVEFLEKWTPHLLCRRDNDILGHIS